MREILFRGKRIDNGEWVRGSFWENCGCPTIIPAASIIGFHVDPETVGQFTGMTDKNGKRVFEGDIIRYGMIYDYECYLESLENPDAYDGEVYDYDIEVDSVGWCIDFEYPAFDLENHQFECNGLSHIMCGDYEYEVIGNIHDNPELLEEKHEKTD